MKPPSVLTAVASLGERRRALLESSLHEDLGGCKELALRPVGRDPAHSECSLDLLEELRPARRVTAGCLGVQLVSREVIERRAAGIGDRPPT
jgi:hypothetical protein